MSKKQYRRFAGSAYSLTPYQFQFLSPEVHRAISQKGGIASGKTRLRKAVLRDYAMNMLENQALAQSATDEFYAAVNKVMRAERKKRRRRKSNPPPTLDENCTETV